MESGTSTPLAHTVNEAIKRLSVSRTTMYELIKAGEVRPFKIGRKTLIPEAELRKVIDSRMAVPAGAK
jgi:excisionase family DNA binding protein